MPAPFRLFLQLVPLSALFLLPSCTLDPSWIDTPEGQAWNADNERYREEMQWQQHVESRKSRN